AVEDYFVTAHDADKGRVIAIFSGRRPRRAMNSRLMQERCAETRKIHDCLFADCYHNVSDYCETLALLLNETKTKGRINESLSYYVKRFIDIEKEDEAIKKEFIVSNWKEMNRDERFVFNKLITGSFRIGVSQKTIVNALAKVVDLDASVIAHRISGNWDPDTTPFSELLSAEASISDFSKPYPFYLAYAVDEDVTLLGEPDLWQAEWKWDGIRGQVIKRNNELFVWSRGEELMTEKFPEYFLLKDLLPDGTVIDGEIIPLDEGKVMAFSVLQTRIGRKNLTKKILEEAPIGFIAYDLIEWNGIDYRNEPLWLRREILEKLVAEVNKEFFQLSKVIPFDAWDELAAIREHSRAESAEGLMLKRKSSMYGAGRKTGDWWKWKINPLTIDAVMIYAQKGSGRRSNLYTDYTFAVKDGDKLVSFAKARSEER